MKQISIITQSETSVPQRMTSLEIAALTGKNHCHVMEAIRKMEPAWVKVNGSNFRLVDYKDKKGELRPCYQLTKTECLYIATKFNDEARAKLVLRWEELELERVRMGSGTPCDIAVRHHMDARPQRALLPAKEVLAMADEIIRDGLTLLNADAEDTLTATQVAKTFNMTVFDFNAVLNDMGIQYRRDGRWNLSDDLQGRGLTAVRTHISYSLKGERKVKHYMTWTLAGLRFLNSKLGYPNF